MLSVHLENGERTVQSVAIAREAIRSVSSIEEWKGMFHSRPVILSLESARQVAVHAGVELDVPPVSLPKTETSKMN